MKNKWDEEGGKRCCFPPMLPLVDLVEKDSPVSRKKEGGTRTKKGWREQDRDSKGAKPGGTLSS